MVIAISDIKKSSVIAGANLSDEVLAAIVKTANNFYDPVIRNKQGEAYGNIDKAMTAAGYTKREGEQTSAFVVRIATEMKASGGDAAKLTKERDDLKAKLAGLEKKIADGAGNEAMKAQLKTLQGKLSQKDADLDAMKAEHASKVSSFEKQIGDLSKTTTDNAFRNAANAYYASIKFDPKLSDTMVNLAKSDIEKKVLEKGTPSIGEGGVLVFKDKDGNVLKNAANNLDPFGFSEFADLVSKDYIVEGGGKGGGGTNTPKSKGGGGAGIAGLAQLPSKQHVTVAIKKHLASEGIAVTSNEYQPAYDKLYETEGVSDLPMTADE